MHPFLSPFLVAVLVAVALPAASQDALHRTQLEVAQCRFDMDHNGTLETVFQPQSSNPDCPCYDPGAAPRLASEPPWPIIGCGGTGVVGPTVAPITCPEIEHEERLCQDLTTQTRTRSQSLVGGSCEWQPWSDWAPSSCPLPCQFLVQDESQECAYGGVTQTRSRIHSASAGTCLWGPWSAWTPSCPAPPALTVPGGGPLQHYIDQGDGTFVLLVDGTDHEFFDEFQAVNPYSISDGVGSHGVPTSEFVNDAGETVEIYSGGPPDMAPLRGPVRIQYSFSGDDYDSQ